MVCLGAVGFTLPVVVVLEFDSACWAVCDAHGLCSGEYLFSELFVFFCACSAHRVSSSLFCVCVSVGVRWWRVAASARRAPPPSNTTLSCSLLSSSSLRFSSFCLWKGVCCVVRAQPCEHARSTTRALVFLGCVFDGCVLHPSHCSVVPTTHCSLLMITVFNAEHCMPLITP